MVTFNEGRHWTEGLLSEAPGQRSRDNIVIASGAGLIVPGMVLGRVSCGNPTSAAKSGGNTGNGTLVLTSGQLLGPGAKPGVYTVRFTTATNFVILDPNLDSLGTFAIGGANGNSAVIASEVRFTITQGATVFVVGDGFDITVPAGSGQYRPAGLTPTNGQFGAEVASAIALYNADATSAVASVAALTTDAEFNGNMLTFGAAITTDPQRAAKVAELAAVSGIKVRY